MTLFSMVGVLSTIAIALPIILLLVFKLAWYRCFPGLLAYYIILLFCNLVLLSYVQNDRLIGNIQLFVHNVLEEPLVLLFLTYFSRTSAYRRKMLIALYVLVGLELAVVAATGFSTTGFSIAKAIGLAVTLYFSLVFFIHQVKLTITYQKALGKALIVCSILFATIGFSYVFAVLNLTNIAFAHDADLIFLLITIFSSISMTIGLIFERKRVRQLAELRTTREELKELYGGGHNKATAPFGTVALNIDKDQF